MQKTNTTSIKQIPNYKINTSIQLGNGTEGAIYSCIHLLTSEEYAVKIESQGSNHIKYEAKVLRYLKGGIGIPTFYSLTTVNNTNYLLMQKLGPNLATIYNNCNSNKKRILKQMTVHYIEQMLLRIEFLHSKNFIHRDIKPENFCLKLDHSQTCTEKPLVYLIDFGIAKQFKNKHSNEHIPYSEGKALIGTPRYASINSHLGGELSRRDDLESLIYTIIYLWKGALPWQGIRGKGDKDKQGKIMDMKVGIDEEELCDQLPLGLRKFFSYVKGLKFEDRPDYKLLYDLIGSIKEDAEEYDRKYSNKKQQQERDVGRIYKDGTASSRQSFDDII